MKGICAIVHENGWAVSNETTLDADKELVTIGEQKYVKDILSLKLFSIFEGHGEINVGDKVECIFKTDDNKKFAFIGDIKVKGKLVTIVHNLLKSERYSEFLTNVKKWQTLKT